MRQEKAIALFIYLYSVQHYRRIFETLLFLDKKQVIKIEDKKGKKKGANSSGKGSVKSLPIIIITLHN